MIIAHTIPIICITTFLCYPAPAQQAEPSDADIVRRFVELMEGVELSDEEARIIRSDPPPFGREGDQHIQEALSAVFEHARPGMASAEFFDAVKAELRRLRRMPLPNYKTHPGALRVQFLTVDTLVQAEMWDPMLLDFAEESLEDDLTTPKFLEPLIQHVANRLWIERQREFRGMAVGTDEHHFVLERTERYPRERVSEFLVNAAGHSDEKVRLAALHKLAGFLSIEKVDGEMRLKWNELEMNGERLRWDVQAAVPILRTYALDETRPFEERQMYLEWLIALDAPGREEYVEVYRAFVFDAEDPGEQPERKRILLEGSAGLDTRLRQGERLKALGFATEEELQPLRDEYETDQEKFRSRTEVIEYIDSNGQRVKKIRIGGPVRDDDPPSP